MRYEKRLKMPKITVILPSLNVGEYIYKCLESVINQTFEKLEILCIDAGSTDGTVEIIKKYASRDPRIKLICSDRKSFGYQMNLGIQNAKGDYIAFVETDDYILPDMYEHLIYLIKKYDVDVVKADFDNIVELPDNQVWTLREKFSPVNEVFYDKEIKVDEHPELYAAEYLYWRGLYKKDFLDRNKIRFNETPGASYQDIGFFYQVYLYANKMLFVRDSYYQYRRNRMDASLFDKNALEKLMKEYQFIENTVKNHSERVNRLEPYYYKRMFRQVYLRFRLMIASAGDSEGALRSLEYFRALLKNAVKNGKVDESVFNVSDWLELQMFLEDIEGYATYQKLLYQVQSKQLQKLLMQAKGNKDIVIFGGGKMGGFCNCILQSHGILSTKVFCDNDEKKQGIFYLGNEVFSPKEAVAKCKDALFILTGGNNNQDMKRQLLDLNVPKNKIVSYQLGVDWLYLK